MSHTTEVRNNARAGELNNSFAASETFSVARFSQLFCCFGLGFPSGAQKKPMKIELGVSVPFRLNGLRYFFLSPVLAFTRSRLGCTGALACPGEQRLW